MERSSIQTKDTWDLSYIYQTNQEFYTDLQKAKDLLQVIYHQKDIFLNDVDSFLKFHEDYIKLSAIFKNYIVLRIYIVMFNLMNKIIKQCMQLFYHLWPSFFNPRFLYCYDDRS